MITDIIDGLKLVAEGIENVKTIAEAFKTGKDYLKTRHPEVQADIKNMMQELSKSLYVIKRASAVLTNFRFAISTDVQSLELRHFNDYFIQSKAEAQLLRDHIEDLRSHCSKVREHAFQISNLKKLSSLQKIFQLLGFNSVEKEQILGEKLDKLAFEDFAVANSAEIMVNCLEKALNDIQNALGNGGAMYPEKIPEASVLLAEYGLEFDKMEDLAEAAIKETRELVKELQ